MVRNYKRKTTDRWSNVDLLKALNDIRSEKLTLLEAASKYGMSRATLYRQYKKFSMQGFQPSCVFGKRTCGGHAVLTNIEEMVLEKTVEDLVKQGIAIKGDDIRRICYEYCRVNGIPNHFNPDKKIAGLDWLQGFLKRNPKVATLIPIRQKKHKKSKKQENLNDEGTVELRTRDGD